MSNYKKLIDTLKEVFMLDKAELDFGIYRIMNQKRKDIEQFLEVDLVPQVKEILRTNQALDSEQIKRQIDNEIETAKRYGNVNPDDLPLVKELKVQYERAGDLTSVENEVFSLLANFFKRYFDNGDFISMRRYKKDVYAIPYEGEEVKLHWANADQYYIKTSEYFKVYRFKLANGKTVCFELVEASTEQNNNKTQGDKERRFAIYTEKVCETVGDEFKIYFTYEPADKKIKQSDLLEQAFDAVKTQIPQDFTDLLSLRPTEKDKQRTLLQKHLLDYTARNTFDYFIHKDLGGFLTRELDFYIKNEVLFIDDLNTRDEQEFLKQLSKIKAIKKIGEKIITFLAQLENFQKKLWLKKKMVVECNYCITLDHVPKDLYFEILNNQAQIQEWIKLFAIDEIKAEKTGGLFPENKVGFAEAFKVLPLGEDLGGALDFLNQNQFLVLDTAFFSETFKWKLIGSIDNFDEQCDGLLINADNFQGLQLINKRFNEIVDCIHIDPPYNTATSGFLYKNTFQHSSWISMMENRISSTINLLADKASYICHIDENEYENLHQLFDSFQIPNAGTLVWDKRNPMNGGSGLATQHEYVIWRTYQTTPINMRTKTIISMLTKANELIKKEGNVNETVRKQFSTWVNNNAELSGGEKAYKYIDDDGFIYQSVSLRAPEPRADKKFHEPLIHPTTKKPCSVPPNGFSRTPDTLAAMMQNGEILFGQDETTQPRQKVKLTLESRRQMSTVLQDAKKGKGDTGPMGIDFPYCHPTSLYDELLACVTHEKNELVLDYFAGSGTSGHSIINLNRDDNGCRKYILVEMGTYFDTVTKPRIQKVVYSKDWKDGKPVSREGISHCFKYMRLESYEDTLNNLALKQTATQQQALAMNPTFKEGYMLNYMLDVEAKESLLNLEWFVNPFNCYLNITKNNELQATKVDLVETFNYLIGLVVENYAVPKEGYVVVTGKNLAGESILVVWRDCTLHNSTALNQFLEKSKYNPLDSEYDRIYVNGDNNVENLKTGDERWKVVLIEEEFGKRMFEQN
jgi:adenine-specific DNA-methyltransferase